VPIPSPTNDDDPNDPYDKHHNAESGKQNYNVNDVDASGYDAHAHVKSMLQNLSTEQLLVQNEAWTQEIRSLDSTMQTLVYENYQKFIHATDAVKSIGMSIGISQKSLDQLGKSMVIVEEKVERIEEHLKESRRAIAEKLKVKSQLENLQSILKLPQTLHKHIADKNYREACRSAEKATKILSNDNFQSFESLRRIQIECQGIISQLENDLKSKLHTWSSRGNNDSFNGSNSNIDPNIDSPKSLDEIYECVAALCQLLKPASQETNDETTDNDISFNLYKCQTLACIRLITRQFLIGFREPGNSSFLDVLLKSANVYKELFGPQMRSYVESDEQTSLFSFVVLSLSEFTSEMKYDSLSIASEEVKNGEENMSMIESILNYANDFIFEMEEVLLFVEKGIPESQLRSFCKNFIFEISSLVESSIQKSIQRQFVAISSNTRDQLNDFTLELRSRVDQENMNIDELKQFARVTIVDITEIAENTISGLSSTLNSMPLDSKSLQTNVTNAARNFILWLARSFEILGGCEDTTGTSEVLRLEFFVNEQEIMTNDLSLSPNQSNDISTSLTDQHKGMNLGSYPDPNPIDYGEISIVDPSDVVSQNRLTIMLIIADMCKVAEQIIIPAINESISRMFDDRKNNAEAEEMDVNTSINADGDVTNTIRDAASRILFQYTQAWANASILTCTLTLRRKSCDLVENSWFATNDVSLPMRPRSEIFLILTFVKSSSLIYSNLFGLKIKPGKIMTTREVSLLSYHQKRSSAFGGRNDVSKLASGQMLLDVERMLTSKTPVFSRVDFSLDSVNAGIIKMMLKAMSEIIRSNSCMSERGYFQIEIDMLFLRVMIPHYVIDSQMRTELDHLLDDIVANSFERCSVIIPEDSEKYAHVNEAICEILDDGSDIMPLLMTVN